MTVAAILGVSAPSAIFRDLGGDGLGDGVEAAAQRFAAVWRSFLTREVGEGKVYTEELRTIRNRIVPVGPRKHPKKVLHRASLPGAPPAKDTGELADSIVVQREFSGAPGTNLPGGRRVPGSVTHAARVFSTDPAATYMEFGVTQHPAGITIAPRPHFRPALQLVQRFVPGDVAVQIQGQARGGRASLDLVRAIRTGIIAFSTVLGDLTALGVRIPGLQRLRSTLLRSGVALGDLHAYARGEIVQRQVNKFVGRKSRVLVNDLTRPFGGIGRRIGNRAASGEIAQLINSVDRTVFRR